MRGWVSLTLEHSGGAVSSASLCADVAVDPSHAGATVYGETGAVAVDCAAAVDAETFATMRREFAAAVAAGRPHPLDVHRGLHLQRLIESAEAQLRA